MNARRPWSHSSRRLTIVFLAVLVPAAAALVWLGLRLLEQDRILWARRSGDSEKQLADAVGVLDLNPSIDRAYIERWAGDLGGDLWLRICGQ